MGTQPFLKIVSLTPSATETLFALGLEHRLVGVTDSCDYPFAARKKPNVSCWFEPDLEKLFALKPDLVVGLESAHRHLTPMLSLQGIEVVLFQPATVDEALSDIQRIGEKLGVSERTKILLKNLKLRLDNLDLRVSAIASKDRPTVCRVLDMAENRLIVAGPLSFQYDVILRAGGRTVTGCFPGAYPKISFSTFKQLDPDIIFFCGHDPTFIPRLAADPAWRLLGAVQSRRLHQFDCGLTCRTGPRIVDMTELLYRTLYPTM